MNTTFARLVAAFAIVAGVATFAAPFAASAAPIQGTVEPHTPITTTTAATGTGSVKVQASTIMATAGFDTSHADDDIVQLSNLTITEIAHVASIQGGPGGFAPGGPYAIVTASAPVGTGCIRYLTENSVRAMPCPPLAMREYSIHITDRTALLGANRTSLSLEQMRVGDRVNAYGYLDRDGFFMDALILRNLDRPQAPKTVQLENLLVTSITLTPSSGAFGGSPIAVISAQADTGQVQSSARCRLYSSESSSVSAPCSAAILASQYTIRVSAQTVLLDVNRGKIGIDRIVTGSRINVYGRMSSDGSVDARVLRDLSRSEIPMIVQLENLRVFKSSSDGNGALDLVAGSNAGVCYEWSATAKRPWTCPMGLTASAAAESDAVASESIAKFSPSVIYRIHVPATAQILDAQRRRSVSRAINVGDTINVYGRMKGETVVAEIVRVTATTPVVVSDPPAPVMTVRGGGRSDAYLDRFSSVSLSAVGGSAPYRWSWGKPGPQPADGQRYTVGLPPGMYLTTSYPCESGNSCADIATDPSQAWIAGTPTTAGLYVFAIHAYDAANRLGQAEASIMVRSLVR